MDDGERSGSQQPREGAAVDMREWEAAFAYQLLRSSDGSHHHDTEPRRAFFIKRNRTTYGMMTMTMRSKRSPSR